MRVYGEQHKPRDYFSVSRNEADIDLADELIGRLNRLIKNEETRRALSAVFQMEVEWGGDPDHPTIQVWDIGCERKPRVRFLGLLNGIVGTVQSGPRAGWGHIGVRFDSETRLIESFCLVEELPPL